MSDRSRTETISAHADLSTIALSGRPLGEVLRRVTELAVDTVPGLVDASVTLIERGKPKTVAFCGHLAAVLDERQYGSGWGPCLDAAREGSAIEVDTDDDTGDYRDFARLARRHGVHHVLALGLPGIEQTRAALNLYVGVGPVDRAMRDAAAASARFASVTLFTASFYAAAATEVAQMKEAMAGRAVIEQAKGIIMNEKHCDADEAFSLLTRASSVTNRKVRDVARELVERSISR